VNPAFPDEPFKHGVLIGIKETKKMHPILRDGLKSAESKQACRARGVYEASGFLDSVMVRDSQNFNSDFPTSGYDRRIVIRFFLKRGVLLVPAQISERVHLQSAAIKTRSIWKFESRAQAV
jgi:hypothetical protein